MEMYTQYANPVPNVRNLMKVGDVFGNLTVLELRELKVLILCVCGQEKEIWRSSVYSNKSCGCLAPLAGERPKGFRITTAHLRLVEDFKSALMEDVGLSVEIARAASKLKAANTSYDD